MPNPAYNAQTVSDTPTVITLYGRQGCHLCEDARAMLDALLAQRRAQGLPSPAVVEHDIDADDDLQRRYMVTVPVIAIGDRELPLATSAAKIRRLLAETLDGESTEGAPA